MRSAGTMTIVTLFIVTAVVPCFSLVVSPDALASQPRSRLFHETTEGSSVSGKISAIGDAYFSADIKKGQDSVPLQRLIKGRTTVEGRLRVGARATIDGRSDDKANIGTRVVVQEPPSSL
jgi:hypothetical protein